MNGIVLINKEKNRTSRDIVNDLVHIFHTKKVGHTGTLDPIASGVLVCTIGKYTKLNEALTNTFKEYIATMQLGVKTDTLDITGNILNEENVNFNEDKIIEALNHFKGKYNQEVPAYSAVKVNGKKLYEYARNNIEVTLPVKEVEIKEIEVLSIENNIVKFKCLVSKGTYIRSLIRDIGEYLNTYAIMLDLIRTKQGKFNIEESVTIDDIRNNNYTLLSIKDVLDVEIIEVDENLYKKVINGVKIDDNYDKEYLLFIKDDEELCLYKRENNKYVMFIKIGD